MKTVKQILEQKAEIENVDVMTALYENDLLNESAYKMLRRAINKDPETMTLAEKRALCEFAKTHLLEATSHFSAADKRFGNKWPSDKQIPPIIVLRRKGIRVFTDNQKIALYYSQALDKYISIPFDQHNKATLGVTMNEESEVNEFLIKEEREEEPKMSADNVRDRFHNKVTALREEALDEGHPALGAAAAGWAALKSVASKAGASAGAKAGKKAAILKKLKDFFSKKGTEEEDGKKKKPEIDLKLKGRMNEPDKPRFGHINARDFVSKAGESSPDSAQIAVMNRWPITGMVQPRNAAIREEKTNFDIIKELSESEEIKTQILFGENAITINKGIAKKIIHIHESLNKTNKKKIERMLNESATTFKEVINFTMRQ